MPSVEYNTYYTGISQDDIISSQPQIIEGDNVTGLKTGYGITLGPKPIKNILTGGVPMYGASRELLTTNEQILLYVGNDGTDGYVYKPNSTDNTPEFILNSSELVNADRLLESATYYNGNYYFVARKTGSNNRYVHSISIGDVSSNNWSAGMNYYLTGLSNTSEVIPPTIVYKGLIFFGFDRVIISYNGTTATQYSFPSGDVVGISVHGTTMLVYSNLGEVAYWDGASANASSTQKLGFIPQRVTQKGNIDFIISTDGDLYIGSGYSFELLVKFKKSNRLNDNSTYIDKFNFNNADTDNVMMEIMGDDLYVVGDGNSLYSYGKLLHGMQSSFHKILTQDNTGVNYDEIFNIGYFNKLKKISISYKRGVVYGIDYIDPIVLTTSKDGYFVTQVFRGPPNKINKIKEVRVTTSYTSGNNYIKIYKRIDNGSWILIRTINDTTDTIKRHKITTNNGSGNLSDEFIDIQFKVELHNDLQTNIPPILHGLELIYSINKE